MDEKIDGSKIENFVENGLGNSKVTQVFQKNVLAQQKSLQNFFKLDTEAVVVIKRPTGRLGDVIINVKKVIQKFLVLSKSTVDHFDKRMVDFEKFNELFITAFDQVVLFKRNDLKSVIKFERIKNKFHSLVQNFVCVEGNYFHVLIVSK